MLDFIVRSHMHHQPPSIPFRPFEGLHSSYQSTNAPCSRQQLSRPSSAQSSSSCSQKFSAPPAHFPGPHSTALWGEGLRTPPPDMTSADSTSYSYGPLKQFQPSIDTSGGAKATNTNFWSASQSNQSTRQQHVRGSPLAKGGLYPEQPKTRRNSSANVGASMTVPASINGSKGNLAEFAAQMTCLFWFESSFVLHKVADSAASTATETPLVPDAIPSMGFRKWVTTILSTTQVSKNVILLALLFIYRLKTLNPTVKGKPGSEFRLLTVALMLGNKYLDDNTYTNKTWAEVSGISVQEIHIMEVEFLSNMRYSLFSSEVEWRDWHSQLGRFSAFWEKAYRTTVEVNTRVPNTPTLATGPPSLPPSLPSPPTSKITSPPYYPARSPSASGFPHLSAPPQLMPAHTPITPMPTPDFQPASSKKRPYEPSCVIMQPPTKRVTRSMAPNISVTVPQFSQTPVTNGPMPRLHPVHGYALAPQTQPQLQQPLMAPSLPPTPLSLPVTRAMSMVYSQPPPAVSAPPSAGPINVSPYSSQSLHTSPYSGHHSVHHSAASSPTTPGFPQQQQSPTWILSHRDSPYRPVRTVNTLLVPPPAFAEPHAVCYDQMHYQPLTKSRTEYKTGLVPYMQTEMWPQSWPMPQPNFQT